MRKKRKETEEVVRQEKKMQPESQSGQIIYF